MNWIVIFNRLFEIINNQGNEAYYGGTRFLNAIREVNYATLTYPNFIEQRRAEGKSTSRRDYYYDLLMEQQEDERIQVVNNILDSVEHIETEKTNILRAIVNPERDVAGPQAVIPADLWNAERLTKYLEHLDTSINDENYEYTLTLAYTCLEGFYKSFIRKKIPAQANLNDLTQMAVQIRNFIRNQLDENGIEYPEQTVILISTVTNAVCNARNNFSDSHSGNRAEKWLAIYLRDNVNALVKMILNFI